VNFNLYEENVGMGSIHDCFSAPGVAAVIEVIVQSEHTGSYQNISTEANTNLHDLRD
jgi:hypothetical protein